jgi:hypothetical protein
VRALRRGADDEPRGGRAVKAADFRAAAARAMNEDCLRDDNIIPLAKQLGWRCGFTKRSDHSPAGIPDLLLVHPIQRRLVIWELKKDPPQDPTPKQLAKVTPTAAQQAWLDDLAAVAEAAGGAVEVGVRRPSDWFSGRIRADLEGRAPTGAARSS